MHRQTCIRNLNSISAGLVVAGLHDDSPLGT